MMPIYKKTTGITLLLSLVLLAVTCVFAGDQLHKAAYHGDIDTVRSLLKTTIDPDERDNYGGTALHAAMFQNNVEIIKLLIDAGLDVNAQGTSNGYTPLHDAVWDNNLEAAKLLIKYGARTDIRGNDGLTPYEKAVKENKINIAEYLKSTRSFLKIYSPEARNNYSENDVKAFVYKWFSGFDHQNEAEFFLVHLDPAHVDMAFPDFPITSTKDFLKWYQGVVDSIQWNSHELSNLEVSGSEQDGFTVSFTVRWQAKTYDGQTYDVNVHQDWLVTVAPNRQFIISRHRARLLK